jgi:putative phosphoesterase
VLLAVAVLVFVISDTHDRLDKVVRFTEVVKSEPGPGYIVHLGDVVSPFTLRALAENIPPTYKLKLVLGNNDGDILLLNKIIGELGEQPEEVEFCGLRVLMLHGFKTRELTDRIVESLACGGHYDVIMYGHTHKYRLNRVCSSYLLNPGSLAGYLTDKSTYAKIDCQNLTMSLIDLETGNSIVNIRMEKRDRPSSS